MSGYFHRTSRRFLGDIIDRRTTRVLARWGSAVTAMLLAAAEGYPSILGGAVHGVNYPHAAVTTP